MTSIHVTTWGRGAPGPITVRVHPDEPAIDAVQRSIERRLGLHICGGPRHDGTALDRHGRPESSHYQMTLGRPVSGGGWSPEAEIWCAIPWEAR